jgi:uncharacterized protein RhaS with RHS repeats
MTTLATATYTIGSYGLVSAKEDSNSHTTYYGYDTDGDLATVTTPLGNETQWGHGLRLQVRRDQRLPGRRGRRAGQGRLPLLRTGGGQVHNAGHRPEPIGLCLLRCGPGEWD